MKSKENIVFLGMMGSGKSTIGKIVSQKLNLEYFDTDGEIEKKLDMKISKIFSEKGENYFRKFEEELTLELLKKKSVVIALGGGTFLNNKVRREILDNHLSIWLKWDDEVLLNRIKNSHKRPIALNSSNRDLSKLIKKRSNIYSKALYYVNCNELGKNQIANQVIKIYENNKIKN
jgi:shikimate kinase/shikimate kinase/3-dehydroquinate synthase